MNLRVFGLIFPVNGTAVGPPQSSGVHASSWRGTRTGSRVSLDGVLIVDGSVCVRFACELQVEEVGGDLLPQSANPGTVSRFQLYDRVVPPVADDAVVVTTPSFAESGSAHGSLRVEAGRLLVMLNGRSGERFAGGRFLPLRIDRADVAFDLDVAARLLTIAERSYVVESRVLQGVEGDGGIEEYSLHRRAYAGNEQLALGLGVHSGPVELRFSANDGKPMPLHSDLQDRKKHLRPVEKSPIVTPLGVSDYDLCVSVEQRVVGAVVTGARLARNARSTRGLLLHAYALATAGNDPESFRAADADADVVLQIRPRDAMWPATFMVGAGLDVLAPTGVDIVRESAGWMHGPGRENRFAPAVGSSVVHSLRCSDVVAYSSAIPDNCDAAVCVEATAPWLAMSGNVSHARPGRSYRPTGARGMKTLSFSGGFGTPLLPDEVLKHSPTLVRAHFATLNATLGALSPAPFDAAEHATRFVEGPTSAGQQLRVRELYLPGAATTDDPRSIALDPHKLVYQFGSDPNKAITVTVLVQPNQPKGYIVIRETDQVSSEGFGFDLFRASGSSLGVKRSLNGQGKDNNRVFGIIKLDRSITLPQIFALERIETEVQNGPSKPFDFVSDILDDEVKTKEWQGLVLFGVGLEYSGFEILKRTIPHQPPLQYLALTPRKSNSLSVSGRVYWEAPAPTVPAKADQQEAHFVPRKLDIAVVDGRLRSFFAEFELTFEGFFGLVRSDARKVRIIGSYDRQTDTIRFAARFDDPLSVLPATGFGPIADARIESVEIMQVKRDGKAESDVRILIDGDLQLRSLEFNGKRWFGAPVNGVPVRFRGLSINLGTITPNVAQWLKLGYPSLRFDLNVPHFSLLGLEALQVKLNRLGVDWDGNEPWGSLFPLFETNDFTKSFFVDLHLNLMKLPELIAKAFDRLSLEFRLGLGLDGGFDSGRFRVGIRGLGFERFNLDLLRFMTVRADKVELVTREIDGVTTPCITASNVYIQILGKTIIDGLSLLIFMQGNGRSGFLVHLPLVNDDTPPQDESNWLRIYWVLIGHNIDIPKPAPGELDLGQQIMAIDAPDQLNDAVDVSKSIQKAVSANRFIPRASDSAEVGEWMFAAGFDVAGLLIGKFLFQDRKYYGIALRAGILKEWFDLDLAISVLYIKRPNPAEDSFTVSVQVPSVTETGLRLQGGVVTIEIAMNGGFTLDVGFPWLDRRGERRWERTFGAIIELLQGSGGFYYSYRKFLKESTDKKQVVLAGGYAAQAGFGASFGGGAFRVWVTVGLYAVLEGEVIFERGTGGGLGKLVGFSVTGAVGILIQGAGELNWWIISVSVEVVAAAEARATLHWKKGQPCVIDFNFILYARASARACIGRGPFKVCKSVSVGVSMPVKTRLKLSS